MSQTNEPVDLIIWSIEDDNDEKATALDSKDYNNGITSKNSVCFISPDKFNGRLSIGDNPFDRAQKLAIQLNDPFEAMEKEATAKALNIPQTAVKTGNLLSLSDDEINTGIDSPVSNGSSNGSKNRTESGIGSVSVISTCSGLYHTALSNTLEDESPPLFMSTKWTPESASSSAAEKSESSANSSDFCADIISFKSKNYMDHRKRLLKLSITNSTFTSPVSHRTVGEEVEINNSKFKLLSEAAANNDPNLLSAESPLKFYDADLMSENIEEPAKKETYDSDLEMLKIPILQQLPSPVIEKSPSIREEEEEEVVEINDKPANTKNFIDFKELRAKIEEKKKQANKTQDITSMLQNLKTWINDCNTVDEKKKKQASSLLETLSNALTTEEKPAIVNASQQSVSPKPIVRQGTFDMDLKAKGEDNDKTVTGETFQVTHTNHLIQLDNIGQAIEEVPDAMIRSSATYDGESAEDKEHLILPEVDPVPVCSPKTISESNVNDIIEKLSRLLMEQQQSAQNVNNESNEISSTTLNVGTTMNPTVIVVMNGSQFSKNTLMNCLNDDESDDDTVKNRIKMRRRSQSLSIHDKIKVVQLPLQTTTITETVQQATVSVSKNQDTDSTKVSETTEFKTPSRILPRRNSFSYGTPYSPSTLRNNNNVGAGVDVGIGAGTGIAPRRVKLGYETAIENLTQLPNSRNSFMDTHYERPKSSLHNFKPDMRKRLKPSESILKSTVPLKATIPIKKVAPRLKVSPPETNDMSVIGTFADSSNLTSTGNLLPKANNIPVTSTPMASARKGAILNSSTGSTPYPPPSPIKKPASTSYKSRYSSCGAIISNSKLKVPSTVKSGHQRRTISPVKSRASTPTVTMKATEKMDVVVGGKTTVNLKNRLSLRPSSRLAMKASNAPNANASQQQHNKENKKP